MKTTDKKNASMASPSHAGPEFLGIGAPRCGTGWLHNNLKQHPQLWLPPHKELHYFDRSFEYPTPSNLAEPALLKRLIGRNRAGQRYRKLIAKVAGGWLKQPSASDLSWCWRFLSGHYDDTWYASLFDQSGSRVAGEITPSYCMLERSDIERVRIINPEMKAIILLRDPIDRAWSSLRKKRLIGQSEENLISTLATPVNSKRTQYYKYLKAWRETLGHENVFVGFFEDVKNRPVNLLDSIHTFLGVKSLGGESRFAGKQINSSKPEVLPKSFERAAAKHYLPMLEALATELDGPVGSWINRAETALKN